MKRSRIVLSAVTCFVSFCLLIVGTFAIASPNVSILGQVSYTVHDAKIVVLGKVSGYANADGEQVESDYPEVDLNNLSGSINLSNQYFDFTTGEGFDNQTDTLQNWTIGDINFYENAYSIKPVTISFKITNLSNYVVSCAVSFDGLEDNTQLSANYLSRTTKGLTNNKIYLEANATKEFCISYKVTDRTKNISGNDFLGMTLSFQQDKVTTDGWEFTTNESDNTCTITKYTGTEKNVVCPSALISNGKSYTVTVIGENNGSSIVDDRYLLETFVIPDTVVKIEKFSFLNCKNLIYIDIPSSVTSVGVEVFESCSNLQEVVCSGADISSGMFIFCNSLTSVTISEGVKNIIWAAFRGCKSLQDITIPSSVLQIKEYIFKDCTNLSSITFEAIVPPTIYSTAFDGCTSLSTIYVPKGYAQVYRQAIENIENLQNCTIIETK